MASAAEQMAANMNWGAFGKAKELQQRILFALALLIVYRIGTYIPVPGIDAAQLQAFFQEANQGIGGMLNMFTGGAVGRMAIFALVVFTILVFSRWRRPEKAKHCHFFQQFFLRSTLLPSWIVSQP